MENINLNPGWEKLYNLNFPEAPATDAGVSASKGNQIIQNINANSGSKDATKMAGISMSKILVCGCVLLLLYAGYRWNKKREKTEGD